MATDEKSARPVRVLIYDIDGPGKAPPHVRPRHADVERDGTIFWQNLTGDEIELILPGQIFDPPTKTLTVGKGAPSDRLTVAADAPLGGHSYFGHRKGKKGGFEFLVGGSNPVIVIR
jgi:hypothetical protein